MTYQIVGTRKHRLNVTNGFKCGFRQTTHRDISELHARVMAGKCSLVTRRKITKDGHGIEWVKEELLYAPLNPDRWKHVGVYAEGE